LATDSSQVSRISLPAPLFTTSEFTTTSQNGQTTLIPVIVPVVGGVEDQVGVGAVVAEGEKEVEEGEEGNWFGLSCFYSFNFCLEYAKKLLLTKLIV
jgi:hypothetical protein